MKKYLRSAEIAILLAAISWLIPSSAVAASRVIVSGGGTGTFNADLDEDGDIDGSHFGLGVIIREDGSAKGHFECLMAGEAGIFGLPPIAGGGKSTARSGI